MKKNNLLIIFATLFLIKSCSDDPELIPGNVSLISPINNELCENGVSINEFTSSVNMIWSESINTEFYDLKLINLITDEEFIFQNINDTSFDTSLTKGFPYSWQVFSKRYDSEAQGESEVWKFYLSGENETNHAPFPADLIYPENSEIINNSNLSINFEWSCIDLDNDELIYTLYLDNIDGMQEPNQNYMDISTNQIQITLESNNNYYWRIKSYDGQSNSYSQIYQFSTE